jgi:hypothetical protein
MYFDTDGVACAFPPGCDVDPAWVDQDGAFGKVKDEWPVAKFGWPRAFYALGPKTYCGDFDDVERSTLDGRTHVKMKGTGLGGNEAVLGPRTFERLVRKQLERVDLHKFCMDRPKDFSVTAAEGTFALRADLSDKRCDVGYVTWHGCELLLTRPWTARDFAGERAHPLCLASMREPCAVCQDTLGACESVTHLECCAHNLHTSCLDRWHRACLGEGRPPSCPLCRHAQ